MLPAYRPSRNGPDGETVYSLGSIRGLRANLQGVQCSTSFFTAKSSRKNKSFRFSTCTQSCVFFSPVQLLLSRGAKKDAEDIWKKTAYDYAVQSGQPESLLAMLRPK